MSSLYRGISIGDRAAVSLNPGMLFPSCHDSPHTGGYSSDDHLTAGRQHISSHDLSYVCDDTACPRSRPGHGFATAAGLDRHRRGQHHSFPPGAKIWVCPVLSCPENSKFWPRYVNFRQHVTRMHGNLDVDQLLAEYVIPKRARARC